MSWTPENGESSVEETVTNIQEHDLVQAVVGSGYKQIFCQDPKAGGGKRSQKFLRDQQGDQQGD